MERQKDERKSRENRGMRVEIRQISDECKVTDNEEEDKRGEEAVGRM